MYKKHFFLCATILGCAITVMAHLASAEAETPKKLKPALKPPVEKSFMCEGTTTRINSNGFAGEGRNERQLTFAATLRPAASEAVIMGVNGSTVLKAGRHLLTKDEKSHLITIPFTDYDGTRDELKLWIRPNGDFAAYTSGRAVTTPGRDLMCGFLGAELCSVSEMYTRVEMSGVCWPAK